METIPTPHLVLGGVGAYAFSGGPGIDQFGQEQHDDDGGLGGGGGGGYSGGGGGGGYSGGGGGGRLGYLNYDGFAGGGGGSYIDEAFANTTQFAGLNPGYGEVTLTSCNPSPNPLPLHSWAQHCWDSQGHFICGGVGRRRDDHHRT